MGKGRMSPANGQAYQRRIKMRRKHWSAPAGLMVFLSQAPRAFSQVSGHEGGAGMMGWGYGWGWFGIVLMVVLGIAVIVGIVALIRWLRGAGGRGKTGGSAD